MEEITLEALLEAGCHFGHKAERWHPKAASFIYTEKDGIHIIDLVKTKAGLEEAAAFVRQTTQNGGEVLFVGTKRQAKGVVKDEAAAIGAPYFSERWIGGFLTNWDSIKKNIDKINRLDKEQAEGGWKKYPKHEQAKLSRYLARLKIFYGGVLHLTSVPTAVFIIDVRKEDAAVREAKRRELPIVAIVDTNADPMGISHVIPANDDAVGSIHYITHVVAEAYKEGKELREKQEKEASTVVLPPPEDKPIEKPSSAKASEGKEEKPAKKKVVKSKKTA